MKRACLLALLLMCGVSAHADSIPLKREGGTYVVNVLINDEISLNFSVDSGAAEVSIPADVFLTLSRTGTVNEEDLLPEAIYRLADGSQQTFKRFRIRSLRAGSHRINDVAAVVSPLEGIPLLGQSFLSKVGSWSIDNDRLLLVINEGGAEQPLRATSEEFAAIPAPAHVKSGNAERDRSMDRPVSAGEVVPLEDIPPELRNGPIAHADPTSRLMPQTSSPQGSTGVVLGYLTGNEYQKFDLDQRMAWLIGALDGMMAENFGVTKDLSGSWVGRCVGKMESTQVMAIFEKELTAKPEAWHAPAAFVLRASLVTACKSN